MKKGIAVAGNMLVDTIYPVEAYPKLGELTTIQDNIKKSTGGAVCNVIVDLAKLDEKLPLTALGVIGQDEAGEFIEQQLSQYKNIYLKQIVHEGTTSFTEVISENNSKQRTFFHYRGANAIFSEKHIPLEELEVDILHIGYILLLDEFDKADEEFGTKLAKFLHNTKIRGIKTSIDVVSDTGNRFKTIVPPALKYTDYCVINEFEAEQITEISLRNESGIIEKNMLAALIVLKGMGVAKWIVIHAPEGSYGFDCVSEEYVKLKSLVLPEGYIKGTNGAGDAYCSGILYGAYCRKTLKAAMELGTACAACSLSKPGATEGMKSVKQVLALYEEMK